MSKIVNLPIIQIPGTTFFPNTVLPIYLSHPTLINMVKDIVTNKTGGLLIIRMEESLSFNHNNDICAAGTPIILDELENGHLKVAVHGLFRIKIINILQDLPYQVAQCTIVPDLNETSQFEESELADLKELLMRWLLHFVRDSSERDIFVDSLKHINQYIDYLSMFLIKDLEMRQTLLATTSFNERVNMLSLILRNNLKENLESAEPLTFKQDLLAIDTIKESIEPDRTMNKAQ